MNTECKELAALAKTMRKSMVSEYVTEKGVTIKLSPLALMDKKTVTNMQFKTPEQAKKEAEDDLYFSATPTRKK